MVVPEGLTAAQVEELSEKLPAEVVSGRQQGGKTLRYLESWYVIQRMNDIFGFTTWSSQIVDLQVVVDVDGTKEGRRNVTYVARVEVEVNGVRYQDTGTGHGLNMSPGDAHESASKEAVSDALKRCCRHLGNQFGLALYDKKFANVSRGSRSETDDSSDEDGPENPPSESQPPSPDPETEVRRKKPGEVNAEIDVARSRLEVDQPAAGSGLSRFIAAMAKLRLAKGPVSYYSVLDSLGYAKSNEITSVDSQKLVHKKLTEAPDIPFDQHLAELKSMFYAKGHGEFWTMWMSTMKVAAENAPEEDRPAILHALYAEFSKQEKTKTDG
jgi:DNA recombination protein Rad52